MRVCSVPRCRQEPRRVCRVDAQGTKVWSWDDRCLYHHKVQAHLLQPFDSGRYDEPDEKPSRWLRAVAVAERKDLESQSANA